ncbi:MAG: hypothetical protein IJZ67_09405 [Alistipes sp.]|nr:hypothetical protein [Alistipes sp.]
MKKEFSKNTTEVFTKTIFHYIPKIQKYIDEIKDPRKRKDYSMRYLIISEMLMFMSEGKSQRFTETAYKDTKYLENIERIIKEEVKKIPDAEIYTNVFSKIEKEEIEDFQYKINYQMIRNKTYKEAKVLGKYNLVLDGTRFQKAHKEISKEWMKETKDGKTTWYLSMLELKLVANNMAVSIMNEMIRNEDKKKENETEEEIRNKSAEQIKQDCEINAAKRLIPKFREKYPRLPVRIIADSLYPSISLIELCEEKDIEYIFVLKDKKIPTILEEFMVLVSMPEGNRALKESKDKIIITLWENGIDYRGKKINVIRQITKNKETGKYSKWMWITNREVTRKNIYKIIYCARLRDYIENQGFREQKVTSGIDLKHVYSKDIKAIKVIYTIIQITHLIMQIIEHSDICGEFNKIYGSVKVFRRKFYAHLTETELNIEQIQIKIQIRFNKSLMIY